MPATRSSTEEGGSGGEEEEEEVEEEGKDEVGGSIARTGLAAAPGMDALAANGGPDACCRDEPAEEAPYGRIAEGAETAEAAAAGGR